MRQKNVASVGLLALGICVSLMAQHKRPITPADCVTVRYLKSEPSNQPSPLTVSPDGGYLAYLVKTPNLVTNENDIELYVKVVSHASASDERPVAVGDLSSLHWLGDSRSVTVLANEHETHTVKAIDVETGKSEVLLKSPDNIDEYVVDRSGHEIVFVVTTPPSGIQLPITERDTATGYRIPFRSLTTTGWPVKRIFVTRRRHNEWTKPEQITIESPLDHKRMSSFIGYDPTLWLSLSPNGEQLSLQYVDPADAMPARWRQSPFVQYENSIKTQRGQMVSVIYHLATGITTAPFETPFATAIPLWSSDSRSFVVFAKPPVDSKWEQQEAELGPSIVRHGHTADLFWVQPESGNVELVATHGQAPYPYAPPLYWNTDGSLLVGSQDGTITRFSPKDGHWEQGNSVKVPVNGLGRLTSDGTHVFGDMQSAAVPPRLFMERLGDPDVSFFADLNPQFSTLALAPVKSVQWETSTGKTVAGTLFLPPGYREGNSYPLVIQTKPYGNWFACGYGPSQFPSFEPEPMASAGIAYLGFYYPDDHDGKGLESYFPKGYPDSIAEAAFETDVYDSAVKMLADSGLIDKQRVGIIGFSRSGWYTEFALAHGKTQYRAATVADNVEYNFSEYAMGSLTGLSSEAVTAMYGGPPYGPTLQNWSKYSISFNVDKIHTPLLMEEMGYGTPFDRRDSPPTNIARTFELFTGLSLLNRPVEYYYYPKEGHEPDDPAARLANLERNLDWYRFWLQGYERAHPEDVDQYARWRELRKHQEGSGLWNSSEKPTAE
jgi:dipeptidyl aminopeptidase/acylaminoacyl peptidase